MLAISTLLAAVAVPAAVVGWRSMGRARGLASMTPSSAAILITGCSSGIGLDAVRHLSAQGAGAIFATVRNEDDAVRLRDEFPTGVVKPLLCDVTVSADVLRLRGEVEKELAARPELRFTGIVNNAGILRTDPGELSTSDVLEAVLATNVVGAYRLTETFLPLLLASGAERHGAPRVVFVGSYFGSFLPGDSAMSYGASKHALEPLSDGLRRRLAPKGIHVALVKPGNIDTNMNTEYAESPPRVVSEAIGDALLSSSPLTRYYPGKFGGLPNRLACALFPLFPDRVADAFWRRMLGGGDGAGSEQ